jgi:predicted RND superfamily exporter protein/lauroyl/myristoyl acyltransferase
MNYRRHWPWLLALIPIVFGLARLRFDVEVLNLLPGDVPAVQGLKIYQQNFANARELIITLRAPDAEKAEACARLIGETLSARTPLTSSVTWQPPWLEHPAQAAELIAFVWLNQPPEAFGQLSHRLATTNLATVLTAAREQLATSLSPDEIAQLSFDPFGLMRLPESATGATQSFAQGQEHFASADGTFRIIFVQAKDDLSSYRACVNWLTQIKSWVQDCAAANSAFRDVTVAYTGRPAFVAEIAGGMEHDITGSVGSTAIIIVLLFWWVHRRWRPLVWLLTLLALILGATLALGGLFFGTLNVVSVGFAAILLGLAVDYGLVLYQESLQTPHLSARELRRILAPSIVWSAVTTAGAFLILNFGGLPGLAQLGSLVAIGVALAAVVMLNFFLPPLLRAHAATLPRPTLQSFLAPSAPQAWIATVLALGGISVVLSHGIPTLEHTANSLRPRHSSAYATLDEIKLHLGRPQEPYWLLVRGQDESEVARRLDQAQRILQQAVADQHVGSFTLPASLWPRPEFQNANRIAAGQLATQRESLRAAAQAHGFTGNALAVTQNILDAWQRMASTTGVHWPTNEMSRWILEKFVARTPTNLYALGLIYPGTNSMAGSAPQSGFPASNAGPLSRLRAELPHDGVWLAGWEILGSALLEVVVKDFWRVMLPMLALLFVSLWLAFKRFTEVLLSLATLGFSLLCLLALMRAIGWSWNLLNLMALPLLLGAGVDYSIHMQLALRRHNGKIAEARGGVGRALFLCAGTTVAGFGSNIWSSNGGLVSLGQVCAAGIAFAYLTSVYLLPIWWKTIVGRESTPERPATQSPALQPATRHFRLSTPSSLYSAELWRLAVALARCLSPHSCAQLSRACALVYWTLARRRREAVVHNLLPPLEGDRTAAETVSRDLFRNFAVKLADLWRYESGQPITSLFVELSGWEHFTQARATRRGVLLLTPHLGNWEFGAPLLAQRGVELLVITLAEPQRRLTEMRLASRARWGIETLVIGRDPFAFVEIIRRLEAGATVALLMDRPPVASAVLVELFGRKFAASIAAAELARAAGCVLLPVYLPRSDGGYSAHILPQIPYDRAALRSREARHKLTQEIMRAFEGPIRQHLDQWYHFVPIWP